MVRHVGQDFVRKSESSVSKRTSRRWLPHGQRYNTKMRLSQVVLFTTLFFLLGVPAYAYGDPTGGSLLPFLFSMLAAIWAMFLIFASRIRRAVSGFMARLRGSKAGDPPTREARDETLPS
jgi:hypothetical protein